LRWVASVVRLSTARLELVVEAVEFAAAVHRDGVMQQAIQPGGRDGAVAEYVAPGPESLASGQDPAPALGAEIVAGSPASG
jgi:hypothetical protein